MTIFKTKKVKHITVGFSSAVLILILISLVNVLTSSPFKALKNINQDQCSWIVGHWAGEFGDGIFTEKWKIIDENKIIGNGCYVQNNDTIFKEELSLIKIGNNWGYISIADDNIPILFTLTENNKNKMVFQNSEHDFPTKIVYLLKADSSLLVTVEGKKFGILMTDEYKMKRVK